MCHRDDAVGDGLKWQRDDAIDDGLDWSKRRCRCQLDNGLEWSQRPCHGNGDGLEWADRLSVLALPAARSWETKRIYGLLFHFFIEKYWAGSQLLTEV